MLDKLIIEFDKGLRTVFAPAQTLRPHPDTGLEEAGLSDQEKRHALGLMRVNHCGEVCAQALYQGQALTARDPATREALKEAAWEETEHLAWTEKRIAELGGRKSLLNPLWYGGSLAMGIAAGLLGDRWNLAFLEETEYQVEAHLNEHLATLPEQDAKSRAIVTQMRDDEHRHAETAHALGAAAMPAPVKGLMHLTSQLMKKTSYHV
ncbi:2-polyprenyl-3-methyl-6-methoxy-1,4-benzoquinone monooxygenase [Laribacter hongkongensis]|uniref:2-polyprenyl-3-methyl-6-methoxy-1,4-benzoquinone monooxygenase n=1 Tax=Laribacter hongkongensis TaxID=168471 RepID=UPI001EFD9C11|nr:2-polyprenyl-3-methyl-6-methoxy-1,4-benzoquinone monooxygenase [Laribacter hongkongensis]MCG8991373.1 2-polyprenyl-3-methyl-6-methoxy-1,4-benzoquinone monooxygenase [Laribacter hongkongensis]MCG9000537.1 2-polyprenyl-3-methyl-6-methoxy-1,4-benzoquinone monooxygenase [Laribacter hongkongensis]MCG9007002.1 2-polyprenyl-3-methyl-6-methoxy-1,4-benzoquinone monooxygenase [Laribacter hongkongensis]MCG9015328.1 2-polyprenyl-3-methyl-6-methoxy-1,4-benzoquinone monooxygenase [Laribacter hongkongensis